MWAHTNPQYTHFCPHLHPPLHTHPHTDTYAIVTGQHGCSTASADQNVDHFPDSFHTSFPCTADCTTTTAAPVYKGRCGAGSGGYNIAICDWVHGMCIGYDCLDVLCLSWCSCAAAQCVPSFIHKKKQISTTPTPPLQPLDAAGAVSEGGLLGLMYTPFIAQRTTISSIIAVGVMWLASGWGLLGVWLGIKGIQMCCLAADAYVYTAEGGPLRRRNTF